jgi:hypothetical protein
VQKAGWGSGGGGKFVFWDQWFRGCEIYFPFLSPGFSGNWEGDFSAEAQRTAEGRREASASKRKIPVTDSENIFNWFGFMGLWGIFGYWNGLFC